MANPEEKINTLSDKIKISFILLFFSSVAFSHLSVSFLPPNSPLSQSTSVAS